MTWHASPVALETYAAGTASDADAWSLETHLPGCARCRDRLSWAMSPADHRKLTQLRGVLTLDTPRPGRSRTRSAALRGVLGPWWAWIGLAALAFFAMAVLGSLAPPPTAPVASWAVALAPLVPIAMVAAIYALADRDAAAQVTPRGGLELVLLRVGSVLGLAFPSVALGLAWSGSDARLTVWLLPALALSAAALALGPTMGVERACAGLTLIWLALVAAASPPTGLTSAAALVEPTGEVQVTWFIVLIALLGLVALRRHRFDLPGAL